MTIFEALVLGLVQGITEFVPVSSSGHLLLTHELLGTGENTLAFDVALHVGTLAALCLYFRYDLIRLAKNIFSKNEFGSLARLLLAATVPAAAAGLLFSDFIDENLRSSAVTAASLAGVGILMLCVEWYSKKMKDVDDTGPTTRQGLSIGVAQILALIPGVSRSGITMTAGIFVGLSREKAARFSFLLALPIVSGSAVGIMLGAGGSSGSLDFDGSLVVGMLAAFISGLLAIKFLLHVISKVGLVPFAVYRIVLAGAVLLFLV